jgi:hypothetical protein
MPAEFVDEHSAEQIFSVAPSRPRANFLSVGAVASDIESQSWREAGRLNAAKASDGELNALLDERKALLQKKLEGDADQRDIDRLEYVRWSLDRIEDARHGQSLDMLESTVAAYKAAVRDLQTLNTDLRRHLPAKRRS